MSNYLKMSIILTRVVGLIVYVALKVSTCLGTIVYVAWKLKGLCKVIFMPFNLNIFYRQNDNRSEAFDERSNF